MMKILALFAITALMPVALGGGVAHAEPGMMVSICSGTGLTKRIYLPLRPERAPDDDRHCMAKGCHGGTSRKRFGAPL